MTFQQTVCVFARAHTCVHACYLAFILVNSALPQRMDLVHLLLYHCSTTFLLICTSNNSNSKQNFYKTPEREGKIRKMGIKQYLQILQHFLWKEIFFNASDTSEK